MFDMALNTPLTAQKLKFSIKDFFSHVTKSAENCEFDHIY